MAVLRPSYSLTLGPQRWTEQVLDIDLSLELAPRLDVLRVRLPAAAPIEAAVGDEVQLALDSGEKSEDVFRGSVHAIRRGMHDIGVRALNAGSVLARYRPAVTYEQITGKSLIEALCSDVGVEVGEVEEGTELAFYVADPSRTALEHVCRASAWSGASVRINADNRLESVVINAGQADVALRFGRELLRVEQGDEPPVHDSFTVAGESGAGETSAPEALRPTTDFFSGSRPAGPGPGKLWQWQPALRTASGAATAGAARQRLHASSRRQGDLTAFLQPDLRPGTVIELSELPAGLTAGPFWLVSVRHRLTAAGATTSARFYGGGEAFDAAGLLGSLAGALGF